MPEILQLQISFMTKLFYAIILLNLNLSCYSQNPDIFYFNKSCQCDSIYIMSYDFVVKDDSTIYSIPKKESFNFGFTLDSSVVIIDNKEYHFLVAGIKKDTVGLVHMDKEYYKYRMDITGQDAILFNFNKKINDGWLISENGYFKNYRIALSNITYDKKLNDKVYSFKCELNRAFPHGYSFIDFRVSKKYGIVGYSLEVDGELGIDTVICDCK